MNGSDQQQPVHAGGCLCGAVRFTIQGPMRPVVNCHCGQCLRFHGHHGAYTNVEMDRLRFEADAALRWYDSSASARRGFCGTCGSSLFWQRRDDAAIGISAGCLDRPTGLATAGDIFVADKGDYYTIEPGRPAMDQGGSAAVLATAGITPPDA